ncbi:MAG TPA: XdhC family protein [Solirubrobacteraceae bacterium]|nr:XdhC family protein [Solirubrobacteraceae bacterium]
MIAPTLAEHARRLSSERKAFVTATVVRAQSPTSARPGDVALVMGDGTIEGFVGGVCAEESVRLHGLRALETGEPLLLRLVPEAGPDEDVVDGAVTAHNPCHSGGTLEIFLDPSLPPPRVVVVGDAPVAQALRELAPHAGLEASDGEVGADDLALVVASHGRDEEPALVAALTAGVPYVGLVASERRGEAVRASLDVADELRDRLRTPAGLAIGARTPAEIALSILAEIVQERRAAAPQWAPVHGGHHDCHHEH